MSRDPDVTRIVRSWLDEGADRMPDRVLDSVMEKLPTTPQRRPRWSVWRLPIMNSSVRAAILAAGLVVASAAAFAVLQRSSGPGTAPSPSASPTSASASPSISAAPSTSPSPIALGPLVQPLGPGEYVVASGFPVPFRITFPAGWALHALSGGDASFGRIEPASGAPGISLDLVKNVFVDPCHAQNGPASPAPASLTELVTVLTSMKGFTAGPVTDATVGGLPAKFVQLTNSINTDTASCSGGPMLPMWTFEHGQEAATNGGATERLWLVDVHGTLVIIDGDSFQGTPQAAIDEIAPIVQSIVFE